MNKGYIMEYAPTETLYAHPQHPYTQTLLAAIPDVDRDDRHSEIELAGGDRTAPGPPPAGCVYQDFCPRGEEACRQTDLPLREVGPDHLVRCWKIDAEASIRTIPENGTDPSNEGEI
jgi:oligopeptide/dipeptide ABC transporter ATP-binding protein